VIDPHLRDVIERSIKERYYPDRTWAAGLHDARAAGAPKVALDRLAGWLPSGRVDQKRLDATAVLTAMALHQAPEGREATFRLQVTEAWREVMAGIDQSIELGNADRAAGDVLDELQLRATDYRHLVNDATVRLVAADFARYTAFRLTDEARVDAVLELRRRHDLLSPEDLHRWLEAQSLSEEEFEALVDEEARTSWLLRVHQLDVRERLGHELQAAGLHGELVERAEDKRATLARAGLSSPTLGDVGMDEDELLDWYFTEVIGQRRPRDIETFARRSGFPDGVNLQRAVLRELVYRRELDRR
jgi:hypothetical protein